MNDRPASKRSETPPAAAILADIAWFRRQIESSGPTGSADRRLARRIYGPFLARRIRLLRSVLNRRSSD